MYPQIVGKDATINTPEQTKARLRDTMPRVMDSRKNHGPPKICPGHEGTVISAGRCTSDNRLYWPVLNAPAGVHAKKGDRNSRTRLGLEGDI